MGKSSNKDAKREAQVKLAAERAAQQAADRKRTLVLGCVTGLIIALRCQLQPVPPFHPRAISSPTPLAVLTSSAPKKLSGLLAASASGGQRVSSSATAWPSSGRPPSLVLLLLLLTPSPAAPAASAASARLQLGPCAPGTQVALQPAPSLWPEPVRRQASSS